MGNMTKAEKHLQRSLQTSSSGIVNGLKNLQTFVERILEKHQQKTRKPVCGIVEDNEKVARPTVSL